MRTRAYAILLSDDRQFEKKERKRKVWILNQCYMCKYDGESVDHLFLNCLAAMDFVVYGFGFICSKLGYAKVVGLLACWQSRFGQHQNGHLWIIVPHYLMWCLWRERNSKCFEDNEKSMPDLKLFFFRTLSDWLSTLQNQSLSSFLDLLNLCNLCT